MAGFEPEVLWDSEDVVVLQSRIVSLVREAEALRKLRVILDERATLERNRNNRWRSWWCGLPRVVRWAIGRPYDE